MKRERNWIELRASSSDDQGSESSPTPPPSAQPERSIDDDQMSQADHDLDLAALSQSMQNVSLRRSDSQLKKWPKNSRKSKVIRNRNPQSGLSAGGAFAPVGNQAVASANQNIPIPYVHAQQGTPGFPLAQLLQTWSAPMNSLSQPGPQNISQPNVSVPPPGYMPWPWPYGLSPSGTNPSQPTNVGMSIPPLWSNLSAPNAHQYVFDRNASMNQLYTFGNISGPISQSQPFGLHSSNTNVIRRGFQKKSRASLQESVGRNKAHNEAQKVRSKLPASSSIRSQDDDSTVCIGTQPI